MSPFLTMVRKEFRQLRRDTTSLRLMVALPVVQLLVLGYALTTEVKHTPIAVVDRSRTPQSRSLTAAVAGNPLFEYLGQAPSEERLRRDIDRGRVKLGLVLPPDFADGLEGAVRIGPGGMETRDGARAQVLVDGQDANSAGVAQGYLAAICGQWATGELARKLAGYGIRLEEAMPVRVSLSVLFNPSLRSAWFMVPGVAVILVTIVTCMLTGFSIVREKEAGTLEQLLVTPLKPIHLVLGKAVPFFVAGLAELLLTLALAMLFFGVPFRGNVLLLLGFAAAFMLSSLGIGIYTSTVARTQQQALFLIWFFLLYFMLLSGFFFPVDNMPAWVRLVTVANPVRWFMEILRGMFLKGSGLAELWRQGLALLVIGVTVFGVALLQFRRQAE